MSIRKILCVIPARAGSKGIPNKNIRIVGNHPLVYYAINNALNSKYITDVLVSTDSNDVRIIASQMGAKVHLRSKELCADKVTLDAVIFDAAAPVEQWDYIVTLQPTSPTLKVSTLDEAIEYAIKNDLDTVISGINAPHLSWRDEDGKKVPNYKERLNRQFLPACYLETGAFVISRSRIVTPHTRIGAKIDIYELSENEAIDIDTFSDLITAAAVLQIKKVAIYVNGNARRGTGHIYRALEIADEFYTKPDIFYDKNQTDPLIFGETTYPLIPVNGIGELFDVCRREQYSIFINDILSTSIDYMIGLKTAIPNAKIINFEDDGEGTCKADLVFNALYANSEAPNEMAGEKYYIARKQFLYCKPIKINEKVKNVLIAFGGSDPQNYTERMLKIISATEYDNYHFCVVLGRAKENAEHLITYQKENIEVLHDVPNMAEIMSQSDIAITSRGRTCYELAMLGVPTIAMSQNKREEKHGFVSEENGFSYIGLDPSDAVIRGNLNIYLNLTIDERQRLQDSLLSHDLRSGRKRVMDLINSL
jgi:CMP-N-acetylneuraminic acid synthetase/spore coat polysaccharide biosynthesis predicted glycosyltransferase SpsG